MGTTRTVGRRSHALVVGGTGMLRDVTLTLANEGHTVSVVARNRQRLQFLAETARQLPGQINSLSLDYRYSAELHAAVGDAIAQNGPIRLAVCWIHSTAPDALRIIAELVADSPAQCRLFHIRGSAAANPANDASRLPEWLDLFPNIQYRQVILGFVVEGGTSRWLTHREISDGVLAAVRQDAPFFVVDTVEPWSMRP